jgi:hypothetical protein
MNRSALAPLALVLAACGADVTTTNGGGGGGDVCAPFTAAPPAAATVTVRLVNRTGNAIYLGQTSAGCDDGVEFTLTDGAGAVLVHDLDVCESTCARLRERSCACAADCALPSAWLVAPYGARTIEWAGTVFRTTTMPASCHSDPQCASAPCFVEELPPAGPLTMAAVAYTEGGPCPNGGSCTCTPDASGSCRIDGATTVGGSRLDATATWKGEASVEIVFH